MQHLVTKWGTAANGGLRYYLMDNEPSLWSWTHRDVHPVGPTMDEIKNTIIDYGAKVRAADPSALVVGSGRVGLERIYLSGYDSAVGRSARLATSNLPDRASSRWHGLLAVGTGPVASSTIRKRASAVSMSSRCIGIHREAGSTSK